MGLRRDLVTGNNRKMATEKFKPNTRLKKKPGKLHKLRPQKEQ